MTDRKKFFGEIAQDWEREHRNNKEKGRLRKLFKHFLLSREDWIMDAGCGTGRLVPFILEAVGEKGILVESDFSREMLKIGKDKYKQKNLYFIQADGQMIPLRENIFDAVVCFALFPHLPDKARALVEFRRILKPGKPLYIAHLMSREELNRFHSRVKGPVTQDFLPAREEMEELFSSAGFREFAIKDERSLYIAWAKA